MALTQLSLINIGFINQVRKSGGGPPSGFFFSLRRYRWRFWSFPIASRNCFLPMEKKNCVHGFRWEKKRIPMVCKTSEFPLQWSCASKNTDTRELVVGWVAFCRWRLIYSSRGYDINHDPSGGGRHLLSFGNPGNGEFSFQEVAHRLPW